jgi:hypothetical protein
MFKASPARRPDTALVAVIPADASADYPPSPARSLSMKSQIIAALAATIALVIFLAETF